MKYTIIRACGHEEEHYICGPVKDRRWRIERLEDTPCFECEKKERLEAAKQKAAEWDLPELTGTEKQIAWAMSIRDEALRKCVRDVEEAERRRKQFGVIGAFEIAKETYAAVFELVNTLTEAKFWIDNRYDVISVIEKMYKNRDDICRAREIEEEAKAEAEAKSETVYPEEQQCNVVVEITATDNEVQVRTEKDTGVIDYMHEIHAKWNSPAWVYSSPAYRGSMKDHAAEIAHNFLKKGYPVKFYDAEIKEKAVNATFEPETDRWIATIKDGTIGIYVRGTDCYDEARRLPGAKYEKGWMKVKATHYNEIEDFANLNGFKITDNAKQMLAAERDKIENAVRVQVADIKAPETKTEEKISTAALIDELTD